MNDSVVNFTTPHPSITAAAFFWTLEIPEMCMLSLNFLFGLPTHAYIIYLIWEGGVALELLTFNLSICEIFFSLNSLIILLSKWFPSVVPLSEFLFGVAITGRPVFQCLICVERYLAVIHPVVFLKFKPPRYRGICCTAAWIIILMSCLCCLLLLISLNFYIYTLFFLVQFLLFLSIKLFCLLAVLRVLKQSGPGERRRQKEEENHMKKRAFHLILINTISMFFTYAPFTTTGLFTLVTQSSISFLWTFGFSCFMLAGFVQPILYLHRKIRCDPP